MELEYLDEFRGCAVDPTRTAVISATADNKEQCFECWTKNGKMLNNLKTTGATLKSTLRIHSLFTSLLQGTV